MKDLQALGQATQTRTIDVLVLGEGIRPEALASLKPTLDLSHTVVLAGPLPVVKVVPIIKVLLGNEKLSVSSLGLANMTLEDYVKSKFSEFVRAMKASSAKSLYSTLIQAVERPLIELALRETHGNQSQAAQLLGLNRNTLRKKILEYQLSVQRRSRSQGEKIAS